MNATCFNIDKKQYPYMFTHILTNVNTIYHSHSHYEFVYIVEGNAVNIIENKEYPLKAGEMSLIRLGDAHKIITEANCVRRDICISSDIFEDLCSLLLPNVFLQEDSAQTAFFEKAKKFTPSQNSVKIFLDKLDHYSVKLDKSDAESRLLAYSFLAEILYELIPKESVSSVDALPPWIKTILLRFENVKIVQAGLSAITEGINYSPIYVNRVFKQFMGVSLRAYLTETKLKLAATYLDTTDYSAIEISDMLGFSSPSFFYKQFKIRYGATPIEYRDRNHDTGNASPEKQTDENPMG